MLQNIYDEFADRLSDELQERLIEMLAEGSKIVEFFQGMDGYAQLYNELLELGLAIGDELEEIEVTTEAVMLMIMIVPPGETEGAVRTVNVSCDGVVGRAKFANEAIMPGDNELIRGKRKEAMNDWEHKIQKWINDNQEDTIKKILGDAYDNYDFQ